MQVIALPWRRGKSYKLPFVFFFSFYLPSSLQVNHSVARVWSTNTGHFNNNNNIKTTTMMSYSELAWAEWKKKNFFKSSIPSASLARRNQSQDARKINIRNSEVLPFQEGCSIGTYTDGIPYRRVTLYTYQKGLSWLWLNSIRWWDFSSGELESVGYPFMVITPRCTNPECLDLLRSMGQRDGFKNYSYPIGILNSI